MGKPEVWARSCPSQLYPPSGRGVWFPSLPSLTEKCPRACKHRDSPQGASTPAQNEKHQSQKDRHSRFSGPLKSDKHTEGHQCSLPQAPCHNGAYPGFRGQNGAVPAPPGSTYCSPRHAGAGGTEPRGAAGADLAACSSQDIPVWTPHICEG